ncbi:MAG: alkaline phosphatase family protein [Vicinamibacterales bacterium]
MRPRTVIAIGLDAADPQLIEEWMQQGHLPTLSALRDRGAYTRLRNFDYCRAEAACTSFLTGCSAWQTGRWTPFRFDAHAYAVEERQAYEFDEYAPFYALGPRYRVGMFDLPQTRLSDGVHGVQVLGWGAHSPRTARASVPADLLPELTARFGEHPAYEKDYVTLWDEPGMRRLAGRLLTGIERRAAICRDLLQREPWDLFVTYFGETHSAGHFFWHLNDAGHPLHPRTGAPWNPLLESFIAVDRAIAEIASAAPPDARLLVFSDHGMEANSTDLPSLVFLPELLYRWSAPGRLGLEALPSRSAVPPPARPTRGRSWTDEVWSRKHDANPITRFLRRRLPTTFFHYSIEKRIGVNGLPLCPEDCPLGHQPPMWYQPAWPEMRAFALPSFSEGYIRFNLRGRERHGIVDPAGYSALCDELEALLRGVRNARTQQPMVARIVRPREAAFTSDDTRLPDADLLVLWNADPADAVDTAFGRIGPLPFHRTGSHVERGFLLASGGDLPLDGGMDDAHALDLAPTILGLMGAPIPAYMEGRPLFGRELRAEAC